MAKLAKWYPVYFVTDYIFHKLRLSAFLKNKMNE